MDRGKGFLRRVGGNTTRGTREHVPRQWIRRAESFGPSFFDRQRFARIFTLVFIVVMSPVRQAEVPDLTVSMPDCRIHILRIAAMLNLKTRGFIEASRRGAPDLGNAGRNEGYQKSAQPLG